MLIFLNFGGPGGRGWWIGPLISLLPFLLSSGLLTAPLQLLQLLLGVGTTRTYYYDPQTQMWRPAGQHGAQSGSTSSTGEASTDDGGSLLASLVVGLTSLIATATLTVLIARFVVTARHNGVGRTLRRMLFEGFGGGWGARREQGAAGDAAGRRPVARTRSERIEHVAKLMQALPLEVYRSRDELERMPVGELKRMLEKRGGASGDCLEKGELVEALLASGNSSASTCSVCCEDYEPGDVLRLLGCGHRFHLECIDRWLLSSTDYSRPPACPMCNAELEKPAAQGSRVAGSGATRA
ncbi:hypothetical protein ABPG77_006058 [Micractinium sp. CCAP 211/92]